MKNFVEYKGFWIAKTSQAFKYWEEKNFKSLDAHIKLLDKKEQELVKRYEQI